MDGCRIVSLPKVTAFDSETLASGEYSEPKRIPLKTLEESAEMVEDLMTIVHAYSCRLYGLRRYRTSKDLLGVE